MNGRRKIRVLIVDDSALIRAILTEVVNSFPDLEAVGAAAHPLQARDMIKALNPDVCQPQIEMSAFVQSRNVRFTCTVTE